MLLTALLVTAVLGPSAYFGYMYNTVDHQNDYIELSMDKVTEIKGKPHEDSGFKMKECCTEERMCLRSIYPEKEAKNQSVEIKQHLWEYFAHEEIVWFHKLEGKWQVACMIKKGKSVEM